MVQYGQNPHDAIYDPFTYFTFGSQRPPVQPPYGGYGYYSGGAWPQGGAMQSPVPAQQPQQPLMKPFVDQNGHFDIGKVVSGATQLASVINQTAPAIKQLSPLLKFFTH